MWRPGRTDSERGSPPRPGLRHWPRVAARVLLVGGWTVVVVVSLLCVYLLAMARPGSVQAVRARARRRAMRIWGRGMMRAVGVRVSVEGVPPPPGALVVSNHLSYLDIPVLGSVMPMVFVAMAELRRWPFWGFAASMGDTIFVDRATRRDVIRVRDEMARARERGDTVIVFPEATSTAGETILPLKPALLADAAAAGTPVHWLTLSYWTPPDGPPARDSVCWWGGAGFVPHVVRLFALRRVHCTVRFGDAPLRSGDRKEMAVELRRAMLRSFVPVGTGAGPRGTG